MLEQMIESKSNGEKEKSRGGYLLTTFVLVVGLFFSAILWSLFAQELTMGNGDFELSALIAPAAVVEDVPPATVEKQEKFAAEKTKNEVPSRQTNTLRVEESPIAPVGVSTAPNKQKSRPAGAFKFSSGSEIDVSGSPNGNSDRQSKGIGNSVKSKNPPSEIEDESAKIPPPPIMKKPIEPAKKPAIVKTGGVLNGKATYLPKPLYTSAAQAVRADGDVSVQVLIDENGRVVSAKAINGHPLLRAEAEKAARNAKFDPTLLSGQPVKVDGLIVYKFSMR